MKCFVLSLFKLIKNKLKKLLRNKKTLTVNADNAKTVNVIINIINSED